MTSEQFKKIRRKASMSLSDAAEYLRVDARSIRRYEDGTRLISGPVSVLMEHMERHDATQILRRMVDLYADESDRDAPEKFKALFSDAQALLNRIDKGQPHPQEGGEDE